MGSFISNPSSAAFLEKENEPFVSAVERNVWAEKVEPGVPMHRDVSTDFEHKVSDQWLTYPFNVTHMEKDVSDWWRFALVTSTTIEFAWGLPRWGMGQWGKGEPRITVTAEDTWLTKTPLSWASEVQTEPFLEMNAN
jgi:hypothetical protein